MREKKLHIHHIHTLLILIHILYKMLKKHSNLATIHDNQ